MLVVAAGNGATAAGSAVATVGVGAAGAADSSKRNGSSRICNHVSATTTTSRAAAAKLHARSECSGRPRRGRRPPIASPSVRKASGSPPPSASSESGLPQITQ
ncbi:MAG: hypothetical protein B6D46_09845 [Polyangiaceae bacterium UTPRO1]|nr:MAG: hypothetical protein B6D46_09845 [Polyangiaceae bacterium UTPRO1]